MSARDEHIHRCFVPTVHFRQRIHGSTRFEQEAGNLGCIARRFLAFLFYTVSRDVVEQGSVMRALRPRLNQSRDFLHELCYGWQVAVHHAVGGLFEFDNHNTHDDSFERVYEDHCFLLCGFRAAFWR
jgi:hypothetical protein